METRNARHIAFFLLSALLGNRFLVGIFLDPVRMEAVGPLLDIWSAFALASVVWIGFSRRPFDNLVAVSPAYWLFCMVSLLALYFQGNLVYYAQFKVLRNIIMVGIWLLAAYGMQSHVIARLRHHRLVQGLLVSVFGLFTLFVVAEIALAWPGRTHAYTRTFANNTWFIRHGGPVNEIGYRDDPAAPPRGNHSKTLLMIGDSFLAGPGIAQIDDRFSGIVQKAFQPRWRCVNLGWGGYDTRDELRAMQHFPYPYDAVVLTWLPNDLLPVADTLGFSYERQFAYSDMGPHGWLVERSFALNYLYWSLPHDDFPSFLPKLKELFEHPAVWEAHQRDLDRVVKACADQGKPLYVVLFPYPQNIAATQFATDKAKAFFESRDVPVLDAGPVWAGNAPDALVLNRNDGHPSLLAHQLLGEAMVHWLEPYLLGNQ